MQPFYLGNYYLSWVDAPGMFHVPSMFDVSGIDEASKARGKEVMGT